MSKRDFKSEIKEWWDKHKGHIKTGLICGTLGIAYGFVKGLTTSDKMWINRVNEIESCGESEPYDELSLDESECDDPELIELIRSENENT